MTRSCPRHILTAFNPDISHYGLGGASSVPSEFSLSPSRNVSLRSPTLNITTFYPPASLDTLVATFRPDSPSTSYGDPWDASSALYVHDDDDVYDVDYVRAHAVCLPGMTHTWGFSFLMLFITLCLLAAWSLGMYIMYMDAYLHSRLDRLGRGMGMCRASYDLAEAMRRDLAAHRHPVYGPSGPAASEHTLHPDKGPDPDGPIIPETMSDADIRRLVRRAPNGTRVSYCLSDPNIPMSRWHDWRIWWQGRGTGTGTGSDRAGGLVRHYRPVAPRRDSWGSNSSEVTAAPRWGSGGERRQSRPSNLGPFTDRDEKTPPPTTRTTLTPSAWGTPLGPSSASSTLSRDSTVVGGSSATGLAVPEFRSPALSPGVASESAPLRFENEIISG